MADFERAALRHIDPARLTLAELRRRPGLKWRSAGPDDVAAWIADMDFPVPAAVRRAIAARAEADLGYPAWLLGDEPFPLGAAYADWMTRRHGHTPDPAHVYPFCDVNQALQVVLQVATEPGDHVAVHTPAYPPFLEGLDHMRRPAVPIPMRLDDGAWRMDLDRFRADVARTRCRVLLLVNPHNPTGRVFRRDELTGLAEVAAEHDLLVISDEIHADLTYAPHRHIPFASLDADTAARTVTLTSASKAFNLAGLCCAIADVGPATVRAALDAQPIHLFGAVSVLSVEATLAAWRDGDDWLAEVRSVLRRNRDALGAALPDGVGYRPPEATYLAWLDFTATGLGSDPAEYLRRIAGVLLSPGSMFGPGGEGHARLNFATGPSILGEILGRIRRAVAEAGTAR